MANTVYENSVLEAKLTELMDSKLQVRGLMTVDDSLTQNAGLTKTVNRYTYSGKVEALESGEANSSVGELTFVPEEYTVKRYQQTFRYNDMEVMKDPSIIDMALSGLADVMANQLRSEYFDELTKADGRHPFAGDALSYGDIVDALGEIGREVEDGLFIIMSAECRANIRRDPDFSAARQGEVMYTGQFGTLCGIPVLFSVKVPAGKAIITDRAAVKFFVKKEANLEQDRDIETKVNTVVYERHGLIALVDDTSTVILGPAADALTVSVSGGVPAVSGKKKSSNSVWYKLGGSAPLLGDVIDGEHGWTLYTSGAVNSGSDESTLVMAECGDDGLCVSAGVAAL